MRISGARVLLTGATGGVGAAIARALSSAGANVALTGRRLDVLAALAQEVDGRAVVDDLTDPSAPQRLVDWAGEVDVLIANAGLPASGSLADTDTARIDRALMVNLRAPMAMARLVLPGMMARRRGHLVLMSSLAGLAASPGASVYTASKFALRGFGAVLRQEVANCGVGVSVIFPGFVRDAGMYADTGVRLPRIVGTSSTAEVAKAVITAVERNLGEVVVAPPLMRLGVRLAMAAPEFTARLQRRFGGHELAEAISQAQADKC